MVVQKKARKIPAVPPNQNYDVARHGQFDNTTIIKEEPESFETDDETIHAKRNKINDKRQSNVTANEERAIPTPQISQQTTPHVAQKSFLPVFLSVPIADGSTTLENISKLPAEVGARLQILDTL